MPTVTVKMSAQQFARLNRLARQRHLPKAQILREALKGATTSSSAPTAFDLSSDLAGSIAGRRDASTNRAYLADLGQPRKHGRRKK